MQRVYTCGAGRGLGGAGRGDGGGGTDRVVLKFEWLVSVVVSKVM